MKRKFLTWMLTLGCVLAMTGCANNDTAQAITQSTEQSESADADSSAGQQAEDASEQAEDNSEQTEDTSEQDLENNPEYIALMEKISQSKAGVPDENGNFTIGTFGSLHSASISLLPDQEYNVSATNYLITETPEAEDNNYTHIQYSFVEDATEEAIANSATDDEQYQEDQYDDVEISSVQTADVNGMSVSWVKHSYTYSYFSEYAKYYGWTMVDDHTGFLIYIEIYGDVGMDTDDNLLNEAFQGVTLT